MKTVKSLEHHVMLERGMDALYKALGPVDARRFVVSAHEMPVDDSVKRHRRWQAGLDKEAFVKRIMAVQRG